MNDAQLCQCGCGRRAMSGRTYAWGHKKGEVRRCACGCGGRVKPGRTWLPGHWAKANPRVAATAALRAKVARRKELAREFAEHGGLVEMQEKSARWDDEWAVAGVEALRDTEAVLESVDRYGYVEVTYAEPMNDGDPLLEVDFAARIYQARKKVKRIEMEFRKAGFTNLTIDEMLYLYENDFDSVEDFAA